MADRGKVRGAFRTLLVPRDPVVWLGIAEPREIEICPLPIALEVDVGEAPVVEPVLLHLELCGVAEVGRDRDLVGVRVVLFEVVVPAAVEDVPA